MIFRLLIAFIVSQKICMAAGLPDFECVPPAYMAIPFAGVLLSISLLPLLAPSLWHKLENFILFFWTALSITMVSVFTGGEVAFHMMGGVMLYEYVPFVLLILALYVISSGFHIHIQALATPFKNVTFIIVGSILANFIGTTGASMLLIRPFIRMNRHRRYQVHNIIFFILIVANIGGCLTPIGDPPLFLGYLNGIDFFWPLKNLWFPFVLVILPLLLIYGLIDSLLMKRNGDIKTIPSETPAKFSIEGKRNFIFLILLVALIVFTGMMPAGTSYSFMGHSLSLSHVLRDVGLVVLAISSYAVTPKSIHRQQHFSWAPISEVARIFATIFITMLPVTLMLKAGENGPFGEVLKVVHSTHEPYMFFWLSGIFSAFLDNAPTYLIFFKMAGGDPIDLMGQHARTLMAISLGSVFMGALTYIGNAPNFMVRSVAKQSGVMMPGFLGYMVWSCGILLPIFLGVTLWLFW